MVFDYSKANMEKYNVSATDFVGNWCEACHETLKSVNHPTDKIYADD